MSVDADRFVQGVSVSSTEPDFLEGLKAAVDYRGDCSLRLVDGTQVEGFIFNLNSEKIDLYPKNDSRPVSAKISSIASLAFSGADAAKGKSWEDWEKKKRAIAPLNGC